MATSSSAGLIIHPSGGSGACSGPVLAAQLRERGMPMTTLVDGAEVSDPIPDVVMHLMPAYDAVVEPVEALTALCLRLKVWAERLGAKPVTLRLVFRGALASRSPVRPVAAAIWAFSRTLANEFPHL